jgi:hypothetical protein
MMRIKATLACCVLALLCSNGAYARQDVRLSPNAPKDKPVDARGGEEVRRFEEAIRPYVEQARKTYPEAKQRFLRGLPRGHVFFVTARLYDGAGSFEQVFVAVREIKDGKIRGVLASEIQTVSGFKQGDPHMLDEGELYDWTISRPDGSEEGNFVGKFLDTLQAGTEPGVVGEEHGWSRSAATPELMRRRIEEAAVKYRAHAPVPRVVFYDIAYPRDAREYKSLDGHGVVLLTALSQERGELPLRRVYVPVGGREVELRLLKLVLSEQAPGDASATTFGPYRADALYLLPLYLRARPGDLLADFTAGRTALKVADFALPLPDDVKALGDKPPAGHGPSADALQQFIRREYPSFFKE